MQKLIQFLQSLGRVTVARGPDGKISIGLVPAGMWLYLMLPLGCSIQQSTPWDVCMSSLVSKLM